MNRIKVFENVKVDKNLPVPIYFQIERIIIDLINNKRLKEGDQLPTEEELCVIFNTSRMTVRQALNSLAKNGYIIKKKAKGTFVASNKISFELSKLHSFSEDMEMRGYRVTNKILQKEIIIPDNKIKEKLNIVDNSIRVFKIKRLRLIDDVPAAIETSHIPLDKCPGIDKEDFKTNSLFKIFTNKYHLIINYSSQTLTPVLAKQEEAKLLEIKENTPLLKMEGITFLNNDVPIEYVIGIYSGERYKFTIEMKR